MIAQIKRIDLDQGIVFGFAPADADEMEARWYKALEASCSAATCDVSSGVLVEFCAMTNQKAARLGVDLPRGLWVGVKPHDDAVFDRIASGEIHEFMLGFDEAGLEINFDQLRVTPANGEINMEKICKCGANFDHAGEIAKCVQRAQSGQATTEQVWSVIEKQASSVQQNGEALEVAVDRLLRLHPELADAYAVAIPAAPTGTIEKRERSVAFDAISKAAKLNNGMSAAEQSVAMLKALENDPQLYERYEQERSRVA